MKKTAEFLVLLILISLGFSCCVKDDPPGAPEELGTSLNIVFPSPPLPEVDGEVTDREGNVYKTVDISNQTWMAENLKTTTYNNGTLIPNVTSWPEWALLSTGAYCWYNNDPNTYRSDYGAFYNGFAVLTGKLCPEGWHVPELSDWSTLINYLGGWEVAGGKLKEAGTTHWEPPNTGATNESGFMALPGGAHLLECIPNLNITCWFPSPYCAIGVYSEWWSATTDTHNLLLILRLFNESERAWGLDTPGEFIEYGTHGEFDREYGREFSIGCYVRCIKDHN